MDSMELLDAKTQILEYLKSVCGSKPKGDDTLAMIGIDSVAMAELTFELEKRFSIKIDDDILDVETVDDLVSYVMARRASLSNQ